MVADRTRRHRRRPAGCRPESRTGAERRGAGRLPARRCGRRPPTCRRDRRDSAPAARGVPSKQLAGPGIDGRHRPLAEDVQILRRQAEAVVRGEERRWSRRAWRGSSSGTAGSARRTGGRWQGSSPRESGTATARRPARSETSPWDDRIPAGCPVRRPPDHGGHFAGSDRLAAPATGLVGGEPVSRRIETNGRRCGPASRANRRKSPWLSAPRIELPDERQVDAADLLGKRLPLAAVEAVPKRQDVFLAVGRKQTFEIASTGGHFPESVNTPCPYLSALRTDRTVATILS